MTDQLTILIILLIFAASVLLALIIWRIYELYTATKLEFQYEEFNAKTKRGHGDCCTDWLNPSSPVAVVHTNLKDSPVPGVKEKGQNPTNT